MFKNFKIEEMLITFNIHTSETGKDDEKIDNIYFKFNKPNNPSTDSIAITLSTLCGKYFNEIYIDLKVSEDVLNKISDFTNAKVTVKEILPEINYNTSGTNAIINFSGGFDSLAAACLIPDAKLVSLDFGGWFEREANFFKIFDPYIVETNFRKLRYDKYSWTFMGAGALLYHDTLNAKYNVFGTSLESTPYNYFQSFAENKKDYPFSYLGFDEIKMIRGLSEVASTMLITKFKPELVNESLCSLSAPKTEKRYRKQLFAEIISEKYNRNVYIEKTEPPETQINFGASFPRDFQVFYIIKNCGLEESLKLVKNIPEEIVDISNKLSLDFYEKYNPNYLKHLPKDIRNHIIKQLSLADILPYNETDWEEFKIIRKYLAKYNPVMDDLSKKLEIKIE